MILRRISVCEQLVDIFTSAALRLLVRAEAFACAQFNSSHDEIRLRRAPAARDLRACGRRTPAETNINGGVLLKFNFTSAGEHIQIHRPRESVKTERARDTGRSFRRRSAQ